jgi:hypothetical protein
MLKTHLVSAEAPRQNVVKWVHSSVMSRPEPGGATIPKQLPHLPRFTVGCLPPNQRWWLPRAPDYALRRAWYSRSENQRILLSGPPVSASRGILMMPHTSAPTVPYPVPQQYLPLEQQQCLPLRPRLCSPLWLSCCLPSSQDPYDLGMLLVGSQILLTLES